MEIDVILLTLDKNSKDFHNKINSTQYAIEKTGCKSNFIIVGPEIKFRGRASDIGCRKVNAPARALFA